MRHEKVRDQTIQHCVVGIRHLRLYRCCRVHLSADTAVKGGEKLDIKFEFKTETKTCYRFEHGVKPELQTLYLKKDTVHGAGIDAHKGIVVSIKEA